MKRLLLYSVFFALFFSACDSSDQIENRSSGAADKDSVLAPIQTPDENGSGAGPVYISKFEKNFLDFQLAVFNEDPATFNEFIDPERGVYIIENPGAVPKMTRVKDIRNFKREFQGHSFFTIKERLQECKLKEEALPTFNCAGDTPNNAAGYSKEGCFVADAEAFRKSEIYKYSDLPEVEQKAIAATMPLVQKTVLDTASSFKFHFGKINNHWRILFIDLMVPCSA